MKLRLIILYYDGASKGISMNSVMMGVFHSVLSIYTTWCECVTILFQCIIHCSQLHACTD